MKTTLIKGAAVSVALIAVSFGSATAASQITAHDLATGAANHRVIADGSVHVSDTTPGVAKALASTFKGAKFRVENYENGGTGSATVACANDDTRSQKYTAISGGVLTGNLSDDQGTDKFAVIKQGPGRMDWDTNTPKPGRLDGWIVAGNTVYTSDLRVWALCVPNTSLHVQQVNLDNKAGKPTRLAARP